MQQIEDLLGAGIRQDNFDVVALIIDVYPQALKKWIQRKGHQEALLVSCASLANPKMFSLINNFLEINNREQLTYCFLHAIMYSNNSNLVPFLKALDRVGASTKQVCFLAMTEAYWSGCNNYDTLVNRLLKNDLNTIRWLHQEHGWKLGQMAVGRHSSKAILCEIIEQVSGQVDIIKDPKQIELYLSKVAATMGSVIKLMKLDPNKLSDLWAGGYAALHTACNYGYLPIVKMLLENGAKVDLLCKKGKKLPIDIARARNHHAIVTLLQSHLSKVVRDGYSEESEPTDSSLSNGFASRLVIS